MPPKAKVDRQMIVDAAFAIAREAGGDKISARAVAQRLNCSTQPVMYHFKTIEELKKAAYREADWFHSEYLIRISGENPILGMGVNYIRFAVEEGNLFRFLFQSNEFSGKSISQLVSAEELQPVIGMLAEAEQLNVQDARTLFRLLFLFVPEKLCTCNFTTTHEPSVLRQVAEHIRLTCTFWSKFNDI